MPFPVQQKLSYHAFQKGIIDYYWPNLRKAIADNSALRSNPNASRLPFDYAKIGAFLTDPQRVERFLIPLEREIRANILRSNLRNPAIRLPHAGAAAKPFTTPTKFASPPVPSAHAYLKAHKVLSNALRKFESESGFNHEKILNGTYFADVKSGTLFSTAATVGERGVVDRISPKVTETVPNPDAGQPGQSPTKVQVREPKPAELKKVDLPKGVPTVVGELDALAFNPLLRHGYQFKDVGAGAYHGEFTHRLQWYAIMAAAKAGELQLFNTPLEIYKSMGYLSAKAPENVATGVSNAQQLWMWQALFDTAENAKAAVQLRTIACQGGQVYTCPETMNKTLMSAEFLSRNAYDPVNPDNLWCLRILLATRWKKRFDQSEGDGPVGGLEKVDTRFGQGRVGTAVSSASMQREVPKFKDIVVPKTITGPLQKDATGKLTATKTVVNVTKSVPDGTESRSIDMGTMHDAGYALVWYLRNDAVT